MSVKVEFARERAGSADPLQFLESLFPKKARLQIGGGEPQTFRRGQRVAVHAKALPTIGVEYPAIGGEAD